MGPGRPLAPQYLADQFTLFQPRRADYPHLLQLPPPPQKKKKKVFHLPASLIMTSCFIFRIVDNGVETVKTYENDVLVSHTVNGQKQAVQHQVPQQVSSGHTVC